MESIKSGGMAIHSYLCGLSIMLAYDADFNCVSCGKKIEWKNGYRHHKYSKEHEAGLKGSSKRQNFDCKPSYNERLKFATQLTQYEGE
jgi:hypothetical protein